MGCKDSCQFDVFIIDNLYHFIWDYGINDSSFIGTFIYQLKKYILNTAITSYF